MPYLYRLLGDLIYLDVVTAEGKSFCITAHTRGFYVNSSKGNVLEPESAKPAMESTTLVGLLRKLSKKFASGIELLLFKPIILPIFKVVLVALGGQIVSLSEVLGDGCNGMQRSAVKGRMPVAIPAF